MEEYTPELDQMLFFLPLAGSTFKKVYYDETKGRAVSKFVPAEHLVVPYETSDLESCPNITQVLRMSLNDLRKKQVSGFYLGHTCDCLRRAIRRPWTTRYSALTVLRRLRSTMTARYWSVMLIWTLRGMRKRTKTARQRVLKYHM